MDIWKFKAYLNHLKTPEEWAHFRSLSINEQNKLIEAMYPSDHGCNASSLYQ